jgi:hypothetical protein
MRHLLFFLPVLLALLAACASGSTGPSPGSTTQADCDKIATDIRTARGQNGVCTSTVPADVAKFGKACAALKDCQDKVAK